MKSCCINNNIISLFVTFAAGVDIVLESKILGWWEVSVRLHSKEGSKGSIISFSFLSRLRLMLKVQINLM